MKTGAVIWDVAIDDYKRGYTATAAPLVVKDKVVVGIAGAEYGIRGFIDAFDAATRQEGLALLDGAWSRRERQRDVGRQFVGARRRIDVGDWHLRSGAGTIYWGTGNPGPDLYGKDRDGDNLYTDAVVALDPATGN